MKNLAVTLILLASFSVLHAQKGKVIDENKTPIEGVLIQNLQTLEVTASNRLGKFTFNKYQSGDSLKAFLLGYETTIQSFSENEDVLFILNESSISLSSIQIRPEMDAMNTLAAVDLAVNPVNSSQELLRYVPGLFIGQHAGGGKAEQIFLRGFDIDHGTDLSINVDNMPVNMVSHAHGQGYSDLHFIIPETVERVDFAKGSYKSDKGNFTTAGSVDFKTKDRLDESTFGIQYGQFNQRRALAMVDLSPKKNQTFDSYVASEYLYSDGPFESPQNLNRFNILGKISSEVGNNQKLQLSASHFTSNWDASGQIPVRAVESGLISRFGAIDDTEGGNTSRTNLQAQYFNQLNDKEFLELSTYYTNYDFLLFSNFTFFANNPQKGDQIRQSENRNLFGVKGSYSKSLSDASNLNISTGVRNDVVADNELSRTFQKETVLSNIYKGDINETNTYLSADFDQTWNRIKLVAGARFDHFRFSYFDQLSANNSASVEQQALLSPKLSVIYQQSRNTQFFFKSGLGYHSNDTRGVVARRADKTLPRSYGADLGSIFKLGDKVLMNATAWYLFLEQEFVYVGDEGIVEPSGRTSRTGVDLSMRAQLLKNFHFNTDLTYTHARSIDDPAGENLIPLAPIFTMSNGLTYTADNGLAIGFQGRTLGNRPANEDNSIVAEGYFVADANVNYTFRQFTLGLIVENIFNTQWNETQFATESRLQNELNAVEEIHFTPGTPFNARVSLRVGI